MRGISLVETVFSAFVVSLAFMALLEIFPTSLLAIKRAEQQTVAAQLVQTVMERSRAAAFASLQPGVNPLPDVPLNGTTFQVHLVVTPLADRLKHLQVVVTWQDPGPVLLRDRKLTADSLVCQMVR